MIFQIRKHLFGFFLGVLGAVSFWTTNSVLNPAANTPSPVVFDMRSRYQWTGDYFRRPVMVYRATCAPQVTVMVDEVCPKCMGAMDRNTNGLIGVEVFP